MGSGRGVRATTASGCATKGAEHPAATKAGRLQQEGVERIGQLSERGFPATGVALYAGEGSKRDGEVKFANSDPALIMFFCAWLWRFFKVVDEGRLRVRLYLHQGLDLKDASSFWSEVTGIPRTQFGKPYRAVPDPSLRTAKHVRGCATVGYSCSATHRAVMGLVHALFVAPRDPG
ncbi:MAG: hypothetical protein ACRDYA_07410 [Egibacteraceae bacterium]